MQYLEDENGVKYNGNGVKAVPETTIEIWNSLLEDGKAPPMWGDTSRESVLYYCWEMYSTFSALWVCGWDWKVKQLATNNYSGGTAIAIRKRGMMLWRQPPLVPSVLQATAQRALPRK